MDYPPPSPPAPCGGVPRNHSGEHNLPITRVVIHSAVMPCRPGAARLLAKWCAEGTTGGSWHYATDPFATVQCAWDRFVCWHAPPNDGSIGIEMADMATDNLARWLIPWQRMMLRRTARLTAQLCLAYDVPLVLLTVGDLKAGRKGIARHASVSLAFGQSTHTDPRAFPADKFMRLVRRYATQLEGASK